MQVTTNRQTRTDRAEERLNGDDAQDSKIFIHKTNWTD